MNAVFTQVRTELVLAIRQGEQLLVALGLPALILVFFSKVDVLPTGTDDPLDFLAPAVLGLAVMSSAMVGLGISTGFERHYGVLKRLGVTPLGRPRLIMAKTLAVLVTITVQQLALGSLAVALGWRPDVEVGAYVATVLGGTSAFAGIGLFMAGRLSGPANLALSNGLYLVLLLAGGVAVPVDELPGWLGAVARLLPTWAVVELLGSTVGSLDALAGRATLVLLVWAVAAPVAALLTFRWQD